MASKLLGTTGKAANSRGQLKSKSVSVDLGAIQKREREKER